MSNVFGNKLKISIFGESHGEAVGAIIDGLPSGLNIDHNKIKRDLIRRQGGKKLSTSRIEKDIPKIVSGYFNDYTTGAPLCVFFENENIKPKDYSEIKDLLRPSHADYSALVKYNGFNDYRGGGYFSGRLTVLLVFIGGICKQLLDKYGVKINSHILQIKDIKDVDFRNLDFSNLSEYEYMVDSIKNNQILELIEDVKLKGDSLGAIVQCGATGIKTGIGDPFFDSLESTISRLAFSIPAIKGIEFGRGFDFVNYKGSEVNDEYFLENEKIKLLTNNNGGVLGGISTGEPLIFNVIVKPTPSILTEQRTVNIEKMTEEKLKINGRHDSCIGLRVLPVIEAITAIGIYEHWS